VISRFCLTYEDTGKEREPPLKKVTTVLINLPLSPHEQAGALEAVANVMQPLGIGYLAAYLEKFGFEVKIIDCRVLQIELENLLSLLKDPAPDIIGVTATVLEIEKAITFSKAAREALPSSLLIIGGPHFTSSPLETMEKSAFDIGVVSEGEETLLEIVEMMAHTGAPAPDRLQAIRGIVYRDGGHIHTAPPRPYIEDLDSLPFPARHLYPPLSCYRALPASYIRKPLGHLITSRGCPHQCIYCDRKVFGNRFRARSPENVVNELEQLLTVHHAREVRFFDDTFTLDTKRVYGILAEIERRELKFPWSCLTRVNCVDLPLLRAMKKSGCWQVSFGLESGDREILERMKKGTTLEQNRQAVVDAKRAGLNVRGYFVLGIPGETRQSIRNTIEFAKSLPIDVATFYTITLYPGSELYERVKSEGRILHQDYSQYNPLIDVNTSTLAYVPDGFTGREFKEIISKAHREFYFRAGYMVRQVLSIRSWSDVTRYWNGFRAILKLGM